MKFKVFTLSLFFTLCFSPLWGQFSNHVNHLERVTYRRNTNSDVIGYLRKSEYYDGLGRLVQTNMEDAAPSGKDVVSMLNYDPVGRQHRQYLPYAASLNGEFDVNATTRIDDFYDANAVDNGVVHEPTYYYDEFDYQSSPLNWLTKQGMPGASWQVDGDHHPVFDKRAYETSDQVKQLYIIGGVIGFSNHANDTWVAISFDENGHETQTFTDPRGRVKCKKIQETETTFLTTYYVYDDFGSLSYVIPPEAVKQMIAPGEGWELLNDMAFRDKWFFSYKYDSRQRMIEKKVPGAEVQYLVYDLWDRLVLSQDGNNRANHINEWHFTKYDALNRPIMTAICQIDATLEEIRSDVYDEERYENTSGLSSHGYTTSRTYPTNAQFSDLEVLSVNYYDDYLFGGLYGFSATSFGYEDNGIDFEDAPNSAVEGQLTGTKVRILGTDDFIYTVNHYDEKYRVIQTTSTNHLEGIDRVSFAYLQHGVLAKTITEHQGLSSTVIEKDFEYDTQDRLLRVRQSVDAEDAVVLFENEYNEIGQLIRKKLFSHDGVQFYQSVDYKYNARGWLIAINGGEDSFNDEEDIFGMCLRYDDSPEGFEQYNGNIGQMSWRVVDGSGENEQAMNYTYTYDRVNRLTAANYNAALPDQDHFTVNNITYDANGNIESLSRNKGLQNMSKPIDVLDYSYSGNQLMAVVDSGDATAVSDATDPDIAMVKDYGFKDGNTAGNDYTYDANGNIVTDLNKGISLIRYNYLNLPERVDFADGNWVEYTYDANGVKLRKQSSTRPKVDYVGTIQYLDDQLDIQIHEEGRYKYGTNKYQFDIKDHLGNVRTTFQVSSVATTVTETIENPNSWSLFDDDRTISIPVKAGETVNISFRGKESSGAIGKVFIRVNGVRWYPHFEMSSSWKTYSTGPIPIDKDGYVKVNIGNFREKGRAYYNSLTSVHSRIEDLPTLEVIQRGDYYPFGGQFNNYSRGEENLYKFNGKEEQKELITYDYGWRQFDPWLGRWAVVDNLSEKYYSYSPYHYAGNNPIRNVDIDGNEFTPAARNWAQRLWNNITDRMSRISEKMSEKMNMIETGRNKKGKSLSYKKIDRLAKQVSDFQNQSNELNAVANEIIALDNSSQVYDINVTNDGYSGKLTYDNVRENVVINIGGDSKNHLATFAHEAKHAYQYETGKLALSYNGVGGIAIYDIADEIEAYKRGQLFGANRNATITESWVRKLGYNLPSGPLDVNSLSHLNSNNPNETFGQTIIRQMNLLRSVGRNPTIMIKQ